MATEKTASASEVRSAIGMAAYSVVADNSAFENLASTWDLATFVRDVLHITNRALVACKHDPQAVLNLFDAAIKSVPR